MQGKPVLSLVKGGVTQNTPDAEYKVDGLAGATLTSNGVSNLIKFWMGEDAFGPYLERVRSATSQVSVVTSINSEKG